MNLQNKRMNDLLRAKAGRLPEAQEQPTAQTGHGSADGGAGSTQRPRPSTNDLVNTAIRDAAQRHKSW